MEKWNVKSVNCCLKEEGSQGTSCVGSKRGAWKWLTLLLHGSVRRLVLGKRGLVSVIHTEEESCWTEFVWLPHKEDCQ